MFRRLASHALRLPLVALALAASVGLSGAACKRNETRSAPRAAAPGGVAQRIVGSWGSACVPNQPGGSTVLEAIVRRHSDGYSGDMLVIMNEFLDPACTQPRGTVSMLSPFAIVPSSLDEGNGGAPARLNVLVQPSSMVVKPATVQEEARLRSQRFCGSENWKAGQELNVSLTNCGDLLLDTSKAGQGLTLTVMPDDSFIIGGIGIPMRRRAVARPTAFSGGNFALQDAATAPQNHKASFQPCSDNPSEACGDFTPDMRLACEYCKGGIDTCKFKKRWRIEFATNIATQLDTRPPGGVCAPPKSDLVRNPVESHDTLRPQLEGGAVAAPSTEVRAPKDAVTGKSPTKSASPAPPASTVTEGEEKAKQRKELVAQAVGFGVGFLNVGAKVVGSGLCGPGAPGCLAATLASIGVDVAVGAAATHLSGQFLDRLFPTPNADKARQQQK